MKSRVKWKSSARCNARDGSIPSITSTDLERGIRHFKYRTVSVERREIGVKDRVKLDTVRGALRVPAEYCAAVLNTYGQ